MPDNSTCSFVEVFPVGASALRVLYAYVLDTTMSSPSDIGGKLAFQLKRHFGGVWVWVDRVVVSDQLVAEDALRKFLSVIWGLPQSLFAGVREISRNENWVAGSRDQSEFVAKGLFESLNPNIKGFLQDKEHTFGKVVVEREHAVRGWVVAHQPAVSISVASRIFLRQGFAEYASGIPNQNLLVGLWVADKTGTLKGEITQIVGTVRNHRERLQKVSGREVMRRLIAQAPDDDLVVKVSNRSGAYDYVGSALRLVVRLGDLERFGINVAQAVKVLRLAPGNRAELVRGVAEIGQNRGFIEKAYSSHKARDKFLTAHDFGFRTELKVGNNQVCTDGQALFKALERYGVYTRSAAYQDETLPIKIGILNAGQSPLKEFLINLQNKLKRIGFAIKSVCNEKLETLTEAGCERAIDTLEKASPDLVLAFFPGEAYQGDVEDEDEPDYYHLLKRLTMGRGIPSQVVYEKTLQNQFALDNIVLGILAKTGNIPFVLAHPLEYTDVVVGIDVAREAKKKLPGSINATAIARIYFSDGKFLKYVIHDAMIEGETIPKSVLQSLFPVKEFQDRRVVIHRDGLFRGQEKAALQDWATQIGADFKYVEVIKSGTPRLYQMIGKNVEKPPKGIAFKLSNCEAFLVSSPPPFQGATPQPLRIRSDANFPIEQALHSVLSLTLLHYGSVREPRVPVTIHYSDKIAGLALRGVKPKDLVGSLPFWL